MSLNELDIPKPYEDDKSLSEANLDSMMTPIETFASNTNANLRQIAIDLAGLDYTYDNDGVGNLAKSVLATIKFPNFQIWQDDFMEAANALASTTWSNAHWTGGGTNGTQAIIAGVNGVMRLDTTATGSRSSSLTFTSANFDTFLAPAIEFQFKASSATNTDLRGGFRVDGSDYIYFEFNTSDSATNIFLSTNNNGAGEVQTDTTVDLGAGSYHKFRIEIARNSSFKVFIDDNRVAATHAGSIRSLATFKPFFEITNKAAAEQKLLDIDYVRIMQNRE